MRQRCIGNFICQLMSKWQTTMKNIEIQLVDRFFTGTNIQIFFN